jgi:hypothetical protein
MDEPTLTNARKEALLAIIQPLAKDIYDFDPKKLRVLIDDPTCNMSNIDILLPACPRNLSESELAM